MRIIRDGKFIKQGAFCCGNCYLAGGVELVYSYIPVVYSNNVFRVATGRETIPLLLLWRSDDTNFIPIW